MPARRPPAELRPVFVGTDVVPALAGDVSVVCADDCQVAADATGAITVEPLGGLPSAAALLERPAVQEWIRRQAAAVIVWKPSVRTEELVRECGVPAANARPAIARRLENKVYFARAAPDAWLPVPGMVAGEAGPALLEAATALRAPYVFQLARGFSGQHTHRAATSADLEALLTAYRGRLCRIAEFVVGDPVTVTGIVGEREVVLGTPCRQVTGIAACTPYPLGSCGNDFGQPAPAANAVRSVAARVAAWLQREGHRGIYGADMVVAPDGEVWCLEVNPRLVASVPLWNLAARDHGEPSMLRWHGAVFADPTVALPARLECDWSQLILHNLRAAPQQPARLQTGVGRIGDDGCFHRTGPLRLRGPAPGEAALVVRQRASRGHEVARVIFQGPCLQADGQLLPRMAALVADLRDGLGER